MIHEALNFAFMLFALLSAPFCGAGDVNSTTNWKNALKRAGKGAQGVTCYCWSLDEGKRLFAT